MVIMTAARFNQDAAKAKRDATREPVFITTRGELTHVLMSAEHFHEVQAKHLSAPDPDATPGPSLGDLLAMPEGCEAAEIPFERIPMIPSRDDTLLEDLMA
jgi:hypothetical protein